MSKRGIFISALALTLIVVGLVISARAAARRKAESIECGNYIVSIGFTGRVWADDHDGHLPSDFLLMSNELPPNFLICPGDHSRKPAASWSVFTPENSSYEIVTTNLKEGDPNGVFLRCKIHGHLGYADGTVFDGVQRRSKMPIP